MRKKLIENLIYQCIKIIDDKNEIYYTFDDKLKQTILNITNNENMIIQVFDYLDNCVVEKILIKKWKNVDLKMLDEDVDESDISDYVLHIVKFDIYKTYVADDDHGGLKIEYFRNKNDASNHSYFIEKLKQDITLERLHEHKIWL